jgi:hypothetical protein
MQQKQQTYKHRHILSSLFMLLALAWLTICLPYVNESEQNFKAQLERTCEETPDTDSGNPLTNTNEEKSESGTSLLSEYLHHPYAVEHAFVELACHRQSHPFAEYLAYHPDMIIPPPEV